MCAMNTILNARRRKESAQSVKTVCLVIKGVYIQSLSYQNNHHSFSDKKFIQMGTAAAGIYLNLQTIVLLEICIHYLEVFTV